MPLDAEAEVKCCASEPLEQQFGPNRARVNFLHTELTQAADSLPLVDVVTMDRVVCCDPDYGRLLNVALGKARRVFAYSYPRARWGVRAATALANAARRIRGSRFRVFVHPPARMEALVRGAGFTPAFQANTVVWYVGVYTRVAAAAPDRSVE